VALVERQARALVDRSVLRGDHPLYTGTKIPSPIPSILQLPDDLRDSEDVMQINFGPNHPSTHGVLRLVVDLLGEEIVGLRAVVGYLHTGFEKNME
jgi:NADH-quinone oxidoreductase subunit D